ncbi:MAG: transcriptional repressor NrdR [Chlamydiales bacterium]|nr:transcriptional repressor NrdR [Chlamydiales bacterium]
MKCPFCGHSEFKVTDSRNAPESNAIKRRRECLKCQKRFTTFETIELTVQVKKRNGTYEDFNLDKLIHGIAASCRNTQISYDQVRVLASDIAAQLMEKNNRDIDSVEIGEIVMDRLKKLDTIAYIRFACVYKRFKDMDELMDAIQTASE